MKDVVRSWPVLLLIFFAPLDVYQFALPGEIHLTIYFALIIALVPSVVVHLRSSYPLPVYLLLIYFAWSLFGVLLAGGHWEGYRGLGVQVMNLLTLIYVLNYIRDSSAVRTAISMVIVSGLLSAVMGMIEFISFVFFKTVVHPPFADLSAMDVGGGYGFMNELMRMHGFFLSSNHLGSFLLAPFGLSLYRSFYSATHRRIYQLISGFLFVTILFGLARNAYLGLLIVLSILLARWAFTLQRRILLAIVAMGCVTVLYAMPETGFDPLDRTNPFFHEKEQQQPTVTANDSKLIWIEHAKAALIGTARTGGIGEGVQNFDDWAFQEGLVAVWGSHSDFIMFLGESGIVGFMSHVLIVLVVCRLCWRRYRVEQQAGLAPLSLYLLAIYLGVVSAGVTRTYYYVNTTFILLGLILQANRGTTPSASAPSNASSMSNLSTMAPGFDAPSNG